MAQEALVEKFFEILITGDRPATRAFIAQAEKAGVHRSQVEYVVSTGFGRHQMASADTQVTDLTASARGATEKTWFGVPAAAQTTS